MGIREIQLSYEIICDGCGLKVEAKSKSRPNYWSGLNIVADQHDYQGYACASANVDRLLCRDCTSVTHAAINKAITERRTLLATTEPTPDAALRAIHEQQGG